MSDDACLPDTYFAPAGRADTTELGEMMRFVREHPLFRALVDSIDGYLMILNPQRQVLAMNPRLIEDLGLNSLDCLLGPRPGEVLNCIHATEGPDGCGSSRTCATCGAVIAILASQTQNQPVEQECLATIHRGNAFHSLELAVRATPLEVGGQRFTVLVLHDISSSKRRAVLEQLFFHDLLNTVGGLVGWSDLLARMSDLDAREAVSQILNLSHRLRDEVESHRQLLAAERGELRARTLDHSASELLAMLEHAFQQHPATAERIIEIEPPTAAEIVHTDAMLLGRILANMVKNALEATGPGERVRVWFERRGERPVFLVHNPGVIPEAVALRIFQRSFSTKSPNRGLGTYSMRLLGESCLGGEVGFSSTPAEGTTFWLALPA